MYRTHIQRADARRVARPRPASLPACGLNDELGASTTQAASMVAAVSAGQDAVRGHLAGVTAGRGGQAQVRNRVRTDPFGSLGTLPSVYPWHRVRSPSRRIFLQASTVPYHSENITH